MRSTRAVRRSHWRGCAPALPRPPPRLAPHPPAMLERPLESSGELVYEAPDHLEERTLAPRVETLVLDHGVLTARRGSRSTTLPLREYPQVAPFVESIRATLAGDRAVLTIGPEIPP